MDRVVAVRNQITEELGIEVPEVKIRDDVSLKPNEYSIFLKGAEVCRQQLLLGHVFAVAIDAAKKMPDGISGQDPVFNLDGVWINERSADRWAGKGITFADHATIISTHLKEVVRDSAFEFLTRQYVHKLMTMVSTTHDKVIEELVRNGVDNGIIKKILESLLKEGVSIRSFVDILETVADNAPITMDPLLLTEHVRERIRRSVIAPYVVDGMLNVCIYSKALEKKIISACVQSNGKDVPFPFSFLKTLVEATRNGVRKLSDNNLAPVILVHASIRRQLSRFLSPYLKGIIVLSHNEISPETKVQSIATIRLLDPKRR